MAKDVVLSRRALRIDQSSEHPLYLFAMTGAELLQFADVSKISRDSAGKLLGYQRPEVKRHIQDIVDYLDSDDVLFPNSIILAITGKVSFAASRGPTDELSTAGTIKLPLPRGGQERPAWIVDGQQRMLALSKSKRADFAIPVAAFIADSIALQRDQFLRINNTKPLPRGLVTELLPEVASPLPARLAARKIPSALCDLLNRTEDSPFFMKIKRASSTREERRKAVIADTSVVKMLEESLSSASGCLFPYRNIATGETDHDGIWLVLTTYWSGIAEVFPEAWSKAPARSRLTHGAGIRSMGRLMDRVMSGIDLKQDSAAKQVVKQLKRIEPHCRWTGGDWEEFGIRWNELQNTPRHISVLSNFLVRCHAQARSTPG